MFKILISDQLSDKCLDILQKESSFEIINKQGLSVPELCELVKDCDALLVRSGTRVTKEILDCAKKLKLIGRAGVGVDNVDVAEATKKGVVVMNTPGGNTISTAEHAFALLMSMARSIPQAYQTMKDGKWDRKSFKGVELSGKILGVIGMGRIGKEVAKRARAFNMTVLCNDPFMSPDMAKKFEVELVSREEIFKKADFITVHTPLTDDTRGIIDEKAISMMKKGVRLINCARGGIIDEKALLDGLDKGIVAAAALDVFEEEPPNNPSLTLHPKVLATPHLGASTTEAQENVAIDIAYQVVDALKNGVINNAVNAPSVDIELAKVLTPYVNLAGKIGRFLSYLVTGQMVKAKILFEGKAANHDMSMPTSAFLEGLLKKSLAEEVNIVNASHMAKELGIEVEESKSDASADYDSIKAEITTNDAKIVLTGTFFGKNEPRIVMINNYYINAKPDGALLYVINKDKPGVIGHIGTVLGKHNVNIADMTVGRKEKNDVALTLINIDQPISDVAVKELRAIDGIVEVRSIEL